MTELVATYLRVSTTNQNLQTQRQPIEDYCKRNNLTILREYADEGISGSLSSRPMLDAMLKDMRNGEIKKIIIYRLDRLGRSLRHLLDILAEIRNKKVQLISISDGLNSSDDSPMGRAFWSLLGTFAQLEREITVERIRAGLLRARREGKLVGRRPGARDKVKRSSAGYYLRYFGKTREQRRLGPRKKLDSPSANVSI